LPDYRRHIPDMNFDISHLLEHWDYQPGQVVVRKFVGKDGQEKIQLRLDLGLLQMNAAGRPDGKRPFGHPTLFDFCVAKLQQHRQKGGDDEGFVLKADECAKLQMEAFQYHHRYICLLQLEDFAGVVRDTTRNLEVFDFVEEYADDDDLAWSLQQFRPQVLMIHTRAVATQYLQTEEFAAAIKEIESGIDRLRAFYEDQGRHDLQGQSPEISGLQHWLEEVNRKRPLSKREQLERDLHEAVNQEDYEKAAKVRDALKKLKSKD
jgi:UvrB/UvrC motif-containing protein